MESVTLTSFALVGVLFVSACSGKAERGIGGEGAAEKPAAGPSNVNEPDDTVVPQAESKRHVLMIVELQLETRVAKTLKARPVDMPLPRRRGPVERGPWQVEVLDAAGAVLYTAPLADASTVRGEFADDSGQISGTHTQKSVAAVTLRLPLLKDAATVRVSRVEADGKGVALLGSVAYPAVQP